MAIKEIKREWSPEQLDHVKHYLLHYESDVKDLPKCCVGSRATVSETDNEYVCAESGWVKAEYVELLSICPSLLSDPDVKIYYDPEKTEIATREFYQDTSIDVAYFPNVKTIGASAFLRAGVQYAIFPNATTMGMGAFKQSGLKEVYMPQVASLTKGAEFDDCLSLEKVYMPELVDANGGSTFTQCPKLTVLDFPKVTSLNRRIINNQTSGLTALILRSETMCTLDSAFLATSPIGTGKCFIYVPAALIDTYKENSVWSNHAAQFRAIEDYPEICDPDWEGHSGDVVIPSGSTLTIAEGATVNDEAGVLGGGSGWDAVLEFDNGDEFQWGLIGGTACTFRSGSFDSLTEKMNAGEMVKIALVGKFCETMHICAEVIHAAQIDIESDYLPIHCLVCFSDNGASYCFATLNITPDSAIILDKHSISATLVT